jgi:hypothetical protein
LSETKEGPVTYIDPIKDAVENFGIEMPELVAEGDLTVESNADSTNEPKPFNKKDIPLPRINEIFMHKGLEYKVVYINEGQHRFTCEPHKGVY